MAMISWVDLKQALLPVILKKRKDLTYYVKLLRHTDKAVNAKMWLTSAGLCEQSSMWLLSVVIVV